MAVYECEVCGHIYDEAREEEKWAGLSDDWACPVCQSPKSYFSPHKEGAQAAPKGEVARPEREGAAAGEWIKVAEPGSVHEGQTTEVVAGERGVALTLLGGKYGAIDNRCTHQGGPLGQGTIDEDGYLRCPWHGRRFVPLTGESPDGPDVQSFPVDARDDGIYVLIERPREAAVTISDIMARTMVNWGVTHVFGMVGHSNLGLAEAIRKLEAQAKLTYVGIRHEGAAAFACSGYAKASGRPAACLTIAGPGATNLLTGLWDAKLDRAPVLALTGQVETQVLGPGAFQEVDLASAFKPVATWSQTVLDSSDHAELMSLALKHAVVKRDVAHLIFPDEIQKLPSGGDAEPSKPEGRLGDTEITPSRASLARAIDLMTKSHRPAIIVGYGAKGHMDSIIALGERLGCPIITTFKGKGLISDLHPLATGVLGRAGTPVSSRCMTDADLLIVFGASFSHHTGIDKSKQIIQVDFDRVTLGKFHPVAVPIWGEIGITGRLLLEQLPGRTAAEDQRGRIAGLWREWRAEKERRGVEDRGKGLNPAIVFQHLCEVLPEDAAITVDVGNNAYSFGRYFECKRHLVLLSGYLGSIGFAFPAAMGAWAALPDRPIVCINGDGGFGQYMAEFTTAVKYNMNITDILLNNGELAKISQEQRQEQYPVWQTSLHNPNFAEYAKNCGGFGLRVMNADELPSAVEEAVSYRGSALVEVLADPELT